MLVRKFFLLLLGVMLVGLVLFTASPGSANPAGVPVDLPAPLMCTTAGDGHWRIDAIAGSNGEFPVSVPCALPANAGKQCAEYAYTITQLKNRSIAHTVVAVSADQDLDSTNPSSVVSPPGEGDSSTGFLEHARHEYAIRFNPNDSVFTPSIVIVEPTSARISTILVKHGNTEESCLIAGPGVPDDVSPFTPVVTSQSQLAAGGQCLVELIYNIKGEVVDVETDPPCTVTQGPVLINGEPLRDNRSPTGITHGNGTCTTYGPPVPSPARTVCR